MARYGRLLICVAVLCAWATALNADAVTEHTKAQNKLMALRAARADGIRRLAERIRGLHITSDTTVKDFVAESDRIETAMRAWLAGVREVGKPKFYEDGTCEVVMEVTLKTVIVNLKQIRNRYYKGKKFKAQDFEKMTVTNKVKILRETGHGAIREELTDSGELIDVKKVAKGKLPMSAAARKYWMAHCTGRGRLMAERAARVEGMRRLAERIKGVYITSRTTVQDFVAESDEINVNMRTFLRGAREVGVRYHDSELIVEVEMQVKLATVLMTLKSWGETHYKGDKIKIKRLEEMILKTKTTIIRETGMGIPPKKYLKGVVEAYTEVAAVVGSAPPWINRRIRATGNGVAPEGVSAAQAKLMAYRAAELDARRKLAEQINGLMITSSTSVQDFVAQNDQIDTSMLAFQQGAKVLDKTKKFNKDGTAEVTVEIELRPLWNMIIHYTRKLSITVK